MADFSDKLAGSLYGQAIGDGMGAPVEGWAPDRIKEQFGEHDFAVFLPPTHEGDPDFGKGAGRITDDTLMAEALILAYMDAGDHLDAYGYAEFMLPHIQGEPVWVPERQKEMNLFDRLWHPEKYPWMRLAMGNADPRSAGVGNCVNCGVAMWMIPAGAVNAGNPDAAYQEGAAIGLAHNESFAVEAGAVMAAAAAAGLGAGATIDDAIASAERLSRDGTHGATVAAVAAADPGDDLDTFISRVRAAIMPFDQREGHVPDDKPLALAAASDIGRPSRLASIEELPAALAVLKYGAGDFIKTLQAGVCYGRDCDSIAGMACGLYGTIYGRSGLTEGLCTEVDKANKRDFAGLAEKFADTIVAIAKKDKERATAHDAALEGAQ